MVKLHIGAFDQVIPGWINTDITPHLYIARVPGLAPLMGALGLMDAKRVAQHRAGIFRQLRKLDLTKRFPFPDNSVDAVHGSHMIASILQEDARHCLAECYRVLKPGGVVRLSAVDLDEAIRNFTPGQSDDFVELMFCLAPSKRAKNRNWWQYNESSLVDRFREAGFREWARCEYRKGRCPDVEIVDVRPGSLFMEAYK